MPSTPLLRIGTRGSELALVQSRWVAERLRQAHPGLAVELVRIRTRGDRIQGVALSRVGGKGLFVKEIETALLEGHVDLAVHSMKDLPTELPDGLCVAAVPERADPRDAIVAPRGMKPVGDPLPVRRGGVVGTGSLRRQAQLLDLRPDLTAKGVRGNVDTRLRKLDRGDFDALILAVSGLRRLGRDGRITRILDSPAWLPAAGQGALALETRVDDNATRDLTHLVNDPQARRCTLAERAMLAALGGGCQVPIGAHAELDSSRLALVGLIADAPGRRLLRASAAGPADRAESIGKEVAAALLAQGGDEILEELRSESEAKHE
jgi:hydroxymethylbilane synthase